MADHAAEIAALRDSGAGRIDPVRLRFIEALARRAAAHEGLARAHLDATLDRLIGALRADTAQAAAQAAARNNEPAPQRSALADLLAHIDHHAAAGAPAPAAPSAVELKALRYFQDTWSTLNARRRLAQSLSTVPENAGPLNSHQLVYRALTLMRGLSPAYLSRFVAHVDALLWLEQAQAAPTLAPVSAREGHRPRHPAARQQTV